MAIDRVKIDRVVIIVDNKSEYNSSFESRRQFFCERIYREYDIDEKALVTIIFYSRKNGIDKVKLESKTSASRCEILYNKFTDMNPVTNEPAKAVSSWIDDTVKDGKNPLVIFDASDNGTLDEVKEGIDKDIISVKQYNRPPSLCTILCHYVVMAFFVVVVVVGYNIGEPEISLRPGRPAISEPEEPPTLAAVGPAPNVSSHTLPTQQDCGHAEENVDPPTAPEHDNITVGSIVKIVGANPRYGGNPDDRYRPITHYWLLENSFQVIRIRLFEFEGEEIEHALLGEPVGDPPPFPSINSFVPLRYLRLVNY